MGYRNVVVLVPGFFGFGRLGDFYYFADRVAALLRGSLESQLGQRVPVMAASTDPAGSLASRQRFLLDTLRYMESDVFKSPVVFHLVGHSTGGVDAQLLQSAQPLIGGSWAEIDPSNVRTRVQSIVTISAPFYGTCLSESPAVGVLSHSNHHLGGWVETTELVVALAQLAIDRTIVHEAVAASMRHASGAAEFLWHLLTDQRLLVDLIPRRMEEVQRAHPMARQIPVTCFVTAAPDEPQERPETREERILELRVPDRFFKLLHRLTGTCGATPCTFPRALRSFSDPSPIQRGTAPVPVLTPATNDGVVNSLSQLLQDPNAKFGGLVVGDHGDVLGHYDRLDPLTGDALINRGFFCSGAGFGDDQFFDLYGRVAAAIVASAKG
ncbi:MAG: hypothetical protein JWN04_4385 [Myxococcaceae bacterium]|nr:hypothetical protein [Myxococcaceae bacterium]